MKSRGRFYCAGAITCYVSLFVARFVFAAVIMALATVWIVEYDGPIETTLRWAVDMSMRCTAASFTWVTTGVGMLLSIVPLSLILKRFLAIEMGKPGRPD